jgi:hypothetical protein
LNPGYIQPTPFYNTNDPAQSKFFWGQHGYQYGPTFDAKQYNQVQAPVTPWGLQQIATPLTGQQITDIINGKPYVSAPVRPATRVEQYVPDTRTPPSYGQVQLQPIYKDTVVNAPVAPTNVDPRYAEVSKQLGANWFNRQQAAAAAGDWETYNLITQQVNSILNPPVTGY